MAVFHMYGDESGKGHKDDYTSFCGYVGHVSVWQGVAELWQRLQMKWQVPAIHMGRIMSPDKKDDAWKKIKTDWGDAWERKRDLMLGEFSLLIRNSPIVSIGAIVDSAHFRTVADADEDFKKLYRDPIFMALHTFIFRGIDATEVIDKRSPIGIVIDEDEEWSPRLYEHFINLRKDLDDQIRKTHSETEKKSIARFRERVHAVSFVNDVSYPGIQAADMISYEARKIMVARMTNPEATSELYDDLTFLRSNQPRFYRPEVIDELRGSLKEAIANGIVTL
ncbi:MAG: DUF3800 domain-containing protein [Candidatus Sulfotelmatobacter sp.]